MRTLAILFTVVVVTRAAPQYYGGGGDAGGGGNGNGGSIRFTQKEYTGLQQALGHRIPVGIYSANQVFSMVEEYPSDFVVLNLPGLSFGGGDAGSGYKSRSGISIAQARTGSLPSGDDDIAELFSEVSQDAVEDVEEAAEESVNRGGLPASPAEAATALQSIASSPELLRRKRQDDDEEEIELSTADELSFAFAGLGSIIGSNIGAYMDATFSANVDLIHGFENIGLLVLDQVEERAKREQERREKRRQKNNST